LSAVDRQPAFSLEVVVHRARLALDRSEVLRVLGNVLARRIEQGEHRHAPVQLRMHVEEERERAEPAHDVLRRVRPVDTQHEKLRPPLCDEPLLRNLVPQPAGRERRVVRERLWPTLTS